MKITFEISSELLAKARSFMERNGVTLDALIEEWIRGLASRRVSTCNTVDSDLPVYGFGGRWSAMEAAGWAEIRDETYRLPSAQDIEPRR